MKMCFKYEAMFFLCENENYNHFQLIEIQGYLSLISDNMDRFNIVIIIIIQ